MMQPYRFTAPLYTADVGRAEQRRPIRVVTRPFEYGIDNPDDKHKIIVPAGFCSDGASVPSLLQFPISNWGIYAQAAIVHDLLYATNLMDRKAADEIFRDAISVLGRSLDDDNPTFLGAYSAFAGYWSVRLGGRRAYDEGPTGYKLRAQNAYERAKVKDPSLAPRIIRDPQKLIDAQCMGSAELALVEEKVRDG